MRFGIITLFPEMFSALTVGIPGRALKKNLLQIDTWNPRDFTQDKHKSVDDHPYGGGPGMVMMAEPLAAAINSAKQSCKDQPTVIYLSPQGRRFNQEMASAAIAKKSLILIAGRYEGIDERIIETNVDEEWSIGDYVLSGGELAAMVIIDAIVRLLPGAIGDENSVTEDSLATGLLKFPQYTRPLSYNNLDVPEVLLSGHHQKIQNWRLKQSLGRTWHKRPDLLEKKTLSHDEVNLLSEFIEEFMQKKPRKLG